MSSTEPIDVGVTSIRRNSAARLLALLARAAFGTASAIVTARLLGPAGKGALSSLLYIAALLTYVAAVGMADAATVLCGQGRVRLQHALQASLAVVGIGIATGILALFAVARLADWTGITTAVAVAAVIIAVGALANTLVGFAEAMELLVFIATLSIASAAASLVVTVLLVGVFDLEILGGVLGALAGVVVTLMASARALRRRGFSFWPLRDSEYVRAAVPLGSILQLTFILAAVAERADILLVYVLAGEAEAGLYAVALALGQLGMYTSSALASAIFPRLASVDDEEARALLPIAVRSSFVTALISACGLAVVVPFTLEGLFGTEYGDAIVPAVLIAAGAVGFGPQLTLARAVAARGHAGLYFGSFGVSVATMVVLDSILIPIGGSTGAATASLIASVAGLAYIVVGATRQGMLRASDLRVRLSDVRYVVQMGWSLVTLSDLRRSAG